MFRDNNKSYYRSDNASTNHDRSVSRPPKKNVLLKEKRQRLAVLDHAIGIIDRHPDDNPDRRDALIKERNSLQHEIDLLVVSEIVHKNLHKRKKLSPDTILAYCEKAIKDSMDAGICFITAEDIADQLDTHVYLVKQCFRDLNHKGVLSQPIHRYLHDCYRPEDSGWAADVYLIRKTAEP